MSNAVSNVVEPAGAVQSVVRAITILDILAKSGEAGVTELAAEIGVHKSTAFRLVTTLEQGGLVEQSEDRGKYRLGMGVLRLAGATSARLDVVQQARPVCRRLGADTGETVNVAVRSGGSALYVDQVAGSSALQSHNWVGQHIPLHATSNGKILISELDEEELAEAVPALTAYTDFTVTTAKELRRELEQVRGQGYAVAVDELEVGLAAVAAPVRSAHGEVVASLSLSGPTSRMDHVRIEGLIPKVTAAAAEVSGRLGWGGR